MPPTTLWLNKNQSSTYNAIESIRSAHADSPLRIVCSHTADDFPASAIADAFETEPRGVVGQAYVEYCLEFCRRHSVDLFIPGKELRPIVRERQRFADAGVRILAAADGDTLKLLDSKARLYQSLEPGLVRIPDFHVVKHVDAFDRACADLRTHHPVICFKPAVSTFGLGFHILTDRGNDLDRLLSGDPILISFADARRRLGQVKQFRDLIVMQYLVGPERSVDCLAHEGELVTCVVRRKPQQSGGAQVIEANPEILELTRRLTTRLKLNGVFNVQFRDSDGLPFLLEINPRMSGGLHYACRSGVEIPYWAVRLALGTATPAQVPQPRTGIKVGQVTKAITLG